MFLRAGPAMQAGPPSKTAGVMLRDDDGQGARDWQGIAVAANRIA